MNVAIRPEPPEPLPEFPVEKEVGGGHRGVVLEESAPKGPGGGAKSPRPIAEAGGAQPIQGLRVPARGGMIGGEGMARAIDHAYPAEQEGGPPERATPSACSSLSGANRSSEFRIAIQRPRLAEMARLSETCAPRLG